MLRTFMKSKIHRATVTEANLNYIGSVTLDSKLIKAAGLLPYEQVDVLNVSNGARLTTYVIEGKKPGNGEVCLNGAAARLCRRGDLVLVVSYVQLDEEEIREFKSTTVLVDPKNRVKRVRSERVWKRS
jgi:aspartate 1-decarboxylase